MLKADLQWKSSRVFQCLFVRRAGQINIDIRTYGNSAVGKHKIFNKLALKYSFLRHFWLVSWHNMKKIVGSSSRLGLRIYRPKYLRS